MRTRYASRFSSMRGALRRTFSFACSSPSSRLQPGFLTRVQQCPGGAATPRCRVGTLADDCLRHQLHPRTRAGMSRLGRAVETIRNRPHKKMACSTLHPQNIYFSANWITRGLTLVVVICPKLPDERSGTLPLLGLLNCGWLNVLKNSVRNCTRCRSVIRVLFNIEKSQLNCPGPWMMPTPEFP